MNGTTTAPIDPTAARPIGSVHPVLEALMLDPEPGPRGGFVLRRPVLGPVAALAFEGGSLRIDRDAIVALKSDHPELPVIFISRSAKPRRETAIRRLGIHYFLAHPLDADELRLVLEVLLRRPKGIPGFERFFTR